MSITASKPEMPVVTAQMVTHASKKEICQKILQVAKVGCAILSLVPPLRIGASIAVRAICMLDAIARLPPDPIKNNNDGVRLLANAARIPIILWGIMGLALASPVIMAISMVADAALQTLLCINALYNKDYKTASLHFVMVVVDVLAVSALITGSWQLMVAAAAVSAAAMASITLLIAFSTKGKDLGTKIDIACNLILTITGCIAVAQTLPTTQARAHFQVDKDKTYFDKHGHPLKPDANGRITIPAEDAAWGQYIHDGKGHDFDANRGVEISQVAPPVIKSAPLLMPSLVPSDPAFRYVKGDSSTPVVGVQTKSSTGFARVPSESELPESA